MEFQSTFFYVVEGYAPQPDVESFLPLSQQPKSFRASNNLSSGNNTFKSQHMHYFIKKRRPCSHLLWGSVAREAMTFLPGRLDCALGSVSSMFMCGTDRMGCEMRGKINGM